MGVDEGLLRQSYDLVTLRVHQSTKIADRTQAIAAKLAGQADAPAVVCLTARGKTANKLISIVEIVKRELAAQSVAHFQYNALTSELVDIPRGSPPQRTDAPPSDQAADEPDGEDSDDAFQTMGASPPRPPLGDTKKRRVPILTVYLSNTPVKELRTAYEYGFSPQWMGPTLLTGRHSEQPCS